VLHAVKYQQQLATQSLSEVAQLGGASFGEDRAIVRSGGRGNARLDWRRRFSEDSR
jgi:hypothetical protein